MREGTGQIAAAILDCRRREQRPRPQGRLLRGRIEGLLEAPLCLVQLDPAHPERTQGDAEAHGLTRCALDEHLERRAQVRCFAIEPWRAALGLGQGEGPARMPLGHHRSRSGIRERVVA